MQELQPTGILLKVKILQDNRRSTDNKKDGLNKSGSGRSFGERNAYRIRERDSHAGNLGS